VRDGPLIHVGYPKTASSWLQAHLFSRSGSAGLAAVATAARINREIVAPNALDFDPTSTRLRFETRLRRVEEGGAFPVVSAERLSGAPHAGGYDSRDLAERLKAVFPQGRVLIAIREQRRMICSLYRQYVRAGGTLPLRSYLDPPQKGRHSMPSFHLDHLKYDRLIRLYLSLFGEDRVLVLPFELFCEQPHEFVSRILRFASPGDGAEQEAARLPYDRRENAAFTWTYVSLRRRLNRHLVRHRLNPTARFPIGDRKEHLDRVFERVDRVVPALLHRRIHHRMTALVEQTAADHFHESNRHTVRLTGLDLARHGYAVS
jgi:hypothetical protein